MKEYRKLVKILKSQCPPAFPVVVRRREIVDDGYCYLEKKKFYIIIDRKLDEKMAIETILHEWAHALDWKHSYDRMSNDELDRQCHGGSWGVAYSQVYCAYEEHFLCCYKCKEPLDHEILLKHRK